MSQTKILIVDDNKSYLAMLNEFLIVNGYDVEQSYNGEEAQKQCIEFMPDIIVTDIVMPEVDGIELLLELRKNNPDIQVIAMSGGNSGFATTYLEMAESLGANVILNKPFELSLLLEEIKKLETKA